MTDCSERAFAGIKPETLDLRLWRDTAFTEPYTLVDENDVETDWEPDTHLVARFPRDGVRWTATINGAEAYFGIPAVDANTREAGEAVEWVVEYGGDDQLVAVGYVVRGG